MVRWAWVESLETALSGGGSSGAIELQKNTKEGVWAWVDIGTSNRLNCIQKKKKSTKEPWTRPEPARFNRAGLGPVLILKNVVPGPAWPVSLKPGSGPVPSKLGPARPVPTPSLEEKMSIIFDQSQVENKLAEEKMFIPCLEDVSKHQSASPQEKDAQEAPLSSPDLMSESECLDHLSTSDDSELVDWSFGENVARSPDFSDGSISDEDSLIEIAIPGGYYVGHQEHDSVFNLQQKMSGLSHQSMFKQHTLLELLAEINEINEEENLFEIDLSMGSIKCSRFEIEA